MRKILLGLIGILISISLYSAPALVSAGPFDSAKSQACQGLEFGDNQTGECDEEGAGDRLDSTVASVINIASLVVGTVAVIMVVVGGLKYVSSQGDSNGTASAKNTILYAVIGLIIVALAQVMVRFVVNKSTEVPTTVNNQPASNDSPDCNVGEVCVR